MGVLTESEVRRCLAKEDLKNMKEFKVSKKDIITPSAKSYLAEKKIALKYIEDIDNTKIEEKEKVEKVENVEKNYKYVTVFGAKLEEKPEHMTHLNGNLLVFKDHKRIAFRGKVDSLESKILETQILCNKNQLNKLVNDLQEILKFVRNLIRCEVLEEKLDTFELQGMNPYELRDKSHHPKQYFGIGHDLIDYSMGEIVIALNSLRSLTREVELAAYEAFKGEYGQVEREDLIRALNRLSSLFWIMIFKFRSGKYK